MSEMSPSLKFSVNAVLISVKLIRVIVLVSLGVDLLAWLLWLDLLSRHRFI